MSLGFVPNFRRMFQLSAYIREFFCTADVQIRTLGAPPRLPVLLVLHARDRRRPGAANPRPQDIRALRSSVLDLSQSKVDSISEDLVKSISASVRKDYQEILDERLAHWEPLKATLGRQRTATGSCQLQADRTAAGTKPLVIPPGGAGTFGGSVASASASLGASGRVQCDRLTRPGHGIPSFTLVS
eukprot:g1262.t1